MSRGGMPAVRVLADTVAIGGGMDIVTSPLFAKPGLAFRTFNYEYGINGGVERLRGIEPFDGHASPSDALYVYLQCTVTIVGISLGDTVVGGSSAATGRVVYLSGAFIALTRTTGAFAVEALKVGGVTKATVASTTPAIDGFLDNTLSKVAADHYQADIAKVPGSGPGRGLAVLNDVVYAWRDNAGATAGAIYKSSASGWTAVPLYCELSFNTGIYQFAEGATVTQGGVTATVKRVVLESGAWGSTAAGRFIITTPTGGAFVAGALSPAGYGTVPAAGAGVKMGTPITLAPGGSLSHDAYSFTSALASKRLYGCDGVNDAFEFDGAVYVPLVTGMGALKPTVARCHKNYLWLAYRGSLQNSAISNPYVWSAVFGASEFSTGDTITNLVSVGGATDAAALMVLCQNALFMLYGQSSTTWNLAPVSRISGAMARSAQDIGSVYALDTPGVVGYTPGFSFGNFSRNTVSMAIQPIARDQTCACSVFVSGLYKYRVFFADGTGISGLPITDKDVQQMLWSVIDYGVKVIFAEHQDIAGTARTFYMDDQGWVYEADRGRSFAGNAIDHSILLHPVSQRSPMVEKTYRQMQIEMAASSACTLLTAAEFGGAETDGYTDPNFTNPTETQQVRSYGSGLFWDLNMYDASYWDAAAISRKTLPLEGAGTSASITIQGSANNELSHTIYALTLLYTPRKVTR